jgi:hypothetical protein
LFIVCFHIQRVNKADGIPLARIMTLPEYRIPNELLRTNAQSIDDGGFYCAFRVIQREFKFSDSQHVSFSDKGLLYGSIFYMNGRFSGYLLYSKPLYVNHYIHLDRCCWKKKIFPTKFFWFLCLLQTVNSIFYSSGIAVCEYN